MRYEVIPDSYFEDFHNSFRGDTSDTFEVCAKCEGACEFNKIGTLLPGEREFMACRAGLSEEVFNARYLDKLLMPDGFELDVLRLINGCPFLDRGTFECNCRQFKVILCEIYPICFHVQDSQVVFEIDDWCPISDTLRYRRYFIEKGIPAVKKLPVPVGWYANVALYDELHFDYVALEQARVSRHQPEIFTFEQLLGFQRLGLNHDPKVRHHPFPDEAKQGPHSEVHEEGQVPNVDAVANLPSKLVQLGGKHS